MQDYRFSCTRSEGRCGPAEQDPRACTELCPHAGDRLMTFEEMFSKHPHSGNQDPNDLAPTYQGGGPS